MKQLMVLRMIMVFAMISPTQIMHARVVAAHSLNEFDSLLATRSYPYTLLVLYDGSKMARRDCGYRRSLKMLMKIVGQLGKSSLYNDGGLQCIKADISKSSLERLMDDYQISSTPAYILLKNGLPLRDKDTQEIIVLYGFVRQSKLRGFISNYLQSELQERAADKAEARRIRDAELAYYWGCGWGAPCGWGGCGWGGYGWGGCGGYPCGASFSCGVGFGCGY